MAKKVVAIKQDERWELEDKLRTLMEAEAIKADKATMKKLKPLFEEKMAAFNALKSEVT